jgi:hypothetical protein
VLLGNSLPAATSPMTMHVTVRTPPYQSSCVVDAIKFVGIFFNVVYAQFFCNQYVIFVAKAHVTCCNVLSKIIDVAKPIL